MQISLAPALRRPALATVAAVALLALVLAATAAALTTVKDAKRETRALRENGRLDIIRATRDRNAGTLIHTVTMRKRVRPANGRERPAILINTAGGFRTDPEYAVFGPRVFRVKRNGDVVAIGNAKLGARGRTWTYRFEAAEIPNLGNYGWLALTSKGNAVDLAPDRHYAGARKQARVLQAAIAR